MVLVKDPKSIIRTIQPLEPFNNKKKTDYLTLSNALVNSVYIVECEKE